MDDTDAPTRLPAIWAYAAVPPYIRPIPVPSQVMVEDGAASFETGFPQLAFVSKAAGGAGPWGKDFQGLLQQVTAGLQWEQAGGPLPFNPDFAAAIGGYPAKAVVASATAGLLWVSLIDANSHDPEATTGFWVPLVSQAVTPSGAYVNKFRNATASVAQRGPSVTVTAGSGLNYTLDGMMVSCTGADVAGAQAGSVGVAPNSLQLFGTSGVTNAQLVMPVESIDAFGLAGETVTFQCLMLNSTSTNVAPRLTVKTAAGGADSWGSANLIVDSVALQIVANGATVRLSHTFAMSPTAQNGASFRLDFGSALNGVGRSLQLGDFDVRVGVAPVIPEMRPYFLELLQCQRYLPSFSGIGGTSTTGTFYWIGGGGTYDAITQGGVAIDLKTPTRVGITGITYNNLSEFAVNYRGVWNELTSLSLNTSTVTSVSMNFISNGSHGNANLGESTNLGGTESALLYCTGAEITGANI